MSQSSAEQPAPTSLFAGDASGLAAAPKRRKKATDAILADHLPPNLGKPLKVAVPNFSDPNRPKTCLEVDFPLVPINALSSLEGNAGKPIYQMSKWWARRRSCVFRALLLAAAMEAPVRRHPDGQPMLGADGKPIIDEDVADQAVWDAYYANHQAAGNFKHLKVLDPFMGGGTTLVEGSRLGFQVAGVDLNPVAWFIVKNELACTDPKEVKAFFDQIEAEVKPQIQPFYATDGVGGRKGTWFKVSVNGTSESREKMHAGFDPATLPPDQRKEYQYEGPEIIYTFWAKHGPCGNLTCGHRTPIFRSPIVATKKLGVKYLACTCKVCKTAFHAELGDARIAPDAEQVVLGNEHPYTIVSQRFAKAMMDYDKGDRKEIVARTAWLADALDAESGFKCPQCGQFAGQFVRDILGKHRGAIRYSEVKKKDFGILPKGQGKKPIYCTLLLDTEWLRGAPGKMPNGTEFGGYADAPVEHTHAWYRERLKNLRLIEVRGVAGAAAGSEQDAASDGAVNEAVIPLVLRIDPLFPRFSAADGSEQIAKDEHLPEPQSLNDLEHLVGFAKVMQVRHVVHSPCKICQPRARKLSDVMRTMRSIYERIAAPERLVFRGGSWRLPRRIADANVTGPFLEICRRHDVKASYCMHNLIETP